MVNKNTTTTLDPKLVELRNSLPEENRAEFDALPEHEKWAAFGRMEVLTAQAQQNIQPTVQDAEPGIFSAIMGVPKSILITSTEVLKGAQTIAPKAVKFITHQASEAIDTTTIASDAIHFMSRGAIFVAEDTFTTETKITRESVAARTAAALQGRY